MLWSPGFTVFDNVTKQDNNLASKPHQNNGENGGGGLVWELNFSSAFKVNILGLLHLFP